MASLFALGVTSVTWMALIAGLIAFEMLIPWRGVARSERRLCSPALGLLMLVAPDVIPALTSRGTGRCRR